MVKKCVKESKYLQKDKHYVVITDTELFLIVVDDSGDLGIYEKEYFEESGV